MHDFWLRVARSNSEEAASANPDPTMRKPAGSPKGENMPPRGGESISPAEETRSPEATQKQVKRDGQD